MRKSWLVLGFVLAALTLGSGKSIKLVTSWKNPEYKGPVFQRILVLGMSDNPAIRQDFEDALAQSLARPGLEMIPGYTILLRPKSKEIPMDYLRAQVREHKIDAVVVSRLVRFEHNITYIPGQAYAIPSPYYRTFYGYYGAVYPVVYRPDYLREDKEVRIETNLYAATPPDGELVWTGTSDTFNPKSAEKAIQGLVKLVVKELDQQSVLPAPAPRS